MHKDGFTAQLTDEELAAQAARDMNNREEERDALDAENRKLRREIHKLNKAMG